MIHALPTGASTLPLNIYIACSTTKGAEFLSKELQLHTIY